MEQSRDGYCQAAKAAPKRPSPLSDEPPANNQELDTVLHEYSGTDATSTEVAVCRHHCPQPIRSHLTRLRLVLVVFVSNKVSTAQRNPSALTLQWPLPYSTAPWCISGRQHHAFCFEVSPSTINPGSSFMNRANDVMMQRSSAAQQVCIHPARFLFLPRKLGIPSCLASSSRYTQVEEYL